jgi:hypothetical protein
MARGTDPIGKAGGTPWTPDSGEFAGDHKVFHLKKWNRLPDRDKVATLRRFAEEYGADPKMRWFTAKVLEQSGAAPRDFPAQAAALLRFVQTHVYYTNEDGEQLQSPWRTLQVKNGDCFAAGTLVLRDDYSLAKIDDIKAGDRIWGADAWSTVEAHAPRGARPVTEVVLNNGSTLRLTEDHKLWVRACAKHGPGCADLTRGARDCRKVGREFSWTRTRVADVQPGWVLRQPEKIECGGVQDDPELAWLDGVYLADGWSEAHKCAISGQDGKPKEAQKHRVVDIVARHGGSTNWQRKYVAIHVGPITARLKRHGAGAAAKSILGLDRDLTSLAALDEGLQADASRNTSGKGWTFGTINRNIAVQYRVLQRILGRSTSWRCVVNHGGFGTNPIYRVGVRQTEQRAEKRLSIKSIHREVEVVETFDIQTSDNCVYLPEADCTVSQCDDMAGLLASMAQSIALPWRFALGGYREVPGGRKKRVRWIEGQPWPKGRVQFVHVYVMLGWPPFGPQKWASAEPTVRGLPLGHDVVLHGIPSGVHGGKDLAGWFAVLPPTSGVNAPIQAQPYGTTELFDGKGSDYKVVEGKGIVANALNAVDYSGLLNSVVQGVATAVAIGWIGKKLGSKGGL